jgi:hypothetical protein
MSSCGPAFGMWGGSVHSLYPWAMPGQQHSNTYGEWTSVGLPSPLRCSRWFPCQKDQHVDQGVTEGPRCTGPAKCILSLGPRLMTCSYSLPLRPFLQVGTRLVFVKEICYQVFRAVLWVYFFLEWDMLSCLIWCVVILFVGIWPVVIIWNSDPSQGSLCCLIGTFSAEDKPGVSSWVTSEPAPVPVHVQ